MKIVPTRDLVAADLPNLEAPFFAAEQARTLMREERTGHQYAAQLLDRLPTYGRGNAHLVDDVIRKIHNGELWLVYGIGDGTPFDPVVSWQEDSPGLGRWTLHSRDAQFSLGHSVDSLNHNGITPQQLARQEAGGTGFLPVSNLAQELRLKRREEALHQQMQTSAPPPAFPSATVAPLLPSATTTERQIPEPTPEIHIEVGLFTDGTLNNADNSQVLEDRINEECIGPFERGEISEAECRYRLELTMGVSYTNAPSNVAKLADLYIEESDTLNHSIRHRFMEYAPGIGTKTGDGDSVMGMATGMGETGIENQVNRLFREVALRIYRLGLPDTMSTLQFDLFGFSRGAASARHAAHEINRGPEGTLGQALQAEGISWPRQVKVRFVGLFDCVAAIINPANGDLSPSNNLNHPVNVYLNPNHVEQAVHLVAANEHRKNFSLNSLRNTDGSLPHNFREISLPGVHSDIGGGYGDSQREDILISPLHPLPDNRSRWPEQSMQWDRLEDLKRQKDREGWIGEFSLPVRSSVHLDPSPSGLGQLGTAGLDIYKQVSDHPAPSGRVELALRMVRQIRGEYSRVTLRIMHELARKTGVPFKDIPNRDDMNLPAELESINGNLLEQVNDGEYSPTLAKNQLDLLRQRYIHYSAHYNPFKFMALGAPTTFRLFRNFSPNAPSPSGERTVHPNQ